MHIKSIAIATALLAASVLPASAQRAQVGELICNVAPSYGVIVGSQQQLRCGFRRARGRTEGYRGTITRVGLDIGFKNGGRLVWAVLADGPTRRRALAGDYVGASGDITFGVGVGANALAGGFGRSIVLNPLSVQGQTGANLALGVAGLALR